MRLRWLDDLGRDLRYATRLMRKDIAFTTVVVLGLALGIGVNTAVFTAHKSLVLRSLDAREPSAMVNLALIRDSGAIDARFSYPDYEAYRDGVHSFSGLIAFLPERMTISDAGGGMIEPSAPPESALMRLGLLPSPPRNAELASVFTVSDNYFKVLGVAPLRGRTFESIGTQELLASRPVLISENYWQGRFSGNVAVLGRTLRLNGARITIIGITPRDFVGTGVAAPDFWAPLRLEPVLHGDEAWLRDREQERYRLFARLANGVGIVQAQAEMTAVAQHLRILHASGSASAQPGTVIAWPGSPFPLPLGQYQGVTLAILFARLLAAVVLAVACANVASLQLARAKSREGELLTRRSLGATRRRLIKQVLTECALLGVLAGVIALYLAWAFLRVAMTLFAEAVSAGGNPTPVFDVTPDLGVFGFVFATSLVAGVLCGLAPSLTSSRSSIVSRSAKTSTAGGRPLQDLLLVVQVSLSLVLLISGSLLVRSAINATSMDPGYDVRHVIHLGFQFPETSRYTASRQLMLVRDLRARLAAVPGVVTVTSAKPPVATNIFRTAVVTLGEQRPSSSNVQSLPYYSHVEDNYFQTLSIPVFLGRTFEPSSDQVEHSAIISESAAALLWPGRNPIGRHVRLGATDERAHHSGDLVADGAAYEIVGVARDTHGVEFDGSGSKHVYLPLTSDRMQRYPILVKTQSDPVEVARAIERVVTSIDPDLMATTSTLEAIRRRSAPFIASSLAAGVTSSVGLLGVLLAAMGIYGTVSYGVVHRTREVGIRMAIGAEKGDVLWLLLRDSMGPVVAGLLLGICLSVGTSYLMRGFLYGLNIVDSASVGGVSLLFSVIALLAAYVPSRRAMRLDPMVALRCD